MHKLGRPRCGPLGAPTGIRSSPIGHYVYPGANKNMDPSPAAGTPCILSPILLKGGAFTCRRRECSLDRHCSRPSHIRPSRVVQFGIRADTGALDGHHRSWPVGSGNLGPQEDATEPSVVEWYPRCRRHAAGGGGGFVIKHARF